MNARIHIAHHRFFTRAFRAIAMAVIVCAGIIAPAQNLPGVSFSAPTTLAPGCTYRTGQRTSPTRLEIRIFEADLTNRNIEVVALEKQTAAPAMERTSTMAARARAVAGINGGYFSGGSGLSSSYVEIEGAVKANNAGTRPPRATFGITHNATPRLRLNRLSSAGVPTTPADATWATAIWEGIGGGPNLVTASAIDMTSDSEGFDAASGVQPDTRQPRAAIGFNATTRKVVMVTVDGRQTGWSDGITCTDLARLMLDLGCTAAMNLDGGGSTTAWTSAGGVVSRPSDTGNVERTVYSAWGIVPRTTIDNTDIEFATAGPTWLSSAQSGFFNTNSVYLSNLSAAGTATWTPNLGRGGRYEVAAWHTSASNRATNAPFAITHRSGTASVAVNQINNGGQWNVLGTYNFLPGSGGKVTLTNAGADGLVVADGVRFTYMGPDTSGVADWLHYEE